MDAPELTIAVEERVGNVVLSVAGEVDLVTSTQLMRALDGLLDRTPVPTQITADLARVGFMDTTGVAVLLAARARAAGAGSRLVVSSTSPYLARLFQITGISRVLSDDGR